MIPANWKKATIGELCQMIKGKSPTMKTKSGEYPLVTMGEEHKTADSYQLDTEAVCVPMISSFGHGKAGLKRVHYIKGKFALSNILTALVVKEPRELSTKYLALYLQTFKDQLIVPLQTGAANMSLRPEKLAGVPVSFPPLRKQEYIVQLLDEVDSLRQLRIQAQNRSSDLFPSVFHKMFGDPVSNPMNWKLMRLGDLGNWRSGGTPSRRKTEYFTGNIPWLSSGELGQIYTYDSNEHITEEAIRDSNAAKIEVGSLLLGMYDTAALKATINQVTCACNQAIAYAQLDSKLVNTIFIYYTIQIGKEHYRRLQRGIRQKNLNLSMIRELLIPVPPLKLQNRFAEIMNEINSILNKQEETLRKENQLYQSILSKSFGGVL